MENENVILQFGNNIGENPIELAQYRKSIEESRKDMEFCKLPFLDIYAGEIIVRFRIAKGSKITETENGSFWIELPPERTYQKTIKEFFFMIRKAYGDMIQQNPRLFGNYPDCFSIINANDCWIFFNYLEPLGEAMKESGWKNFSVWSGTAEKFLKGSIPDFEDSSFISSFLQGLLNKSKQRSFIIHYNLKNLK